MSVSGIRSSKARLLVTVIIVLGGLLATACGGSGTSGSKHAPKRPGKPAGLTISTAAGSFGKHLVGASGRSIYLWVADKSSTSTCTGACAGNWPPVIAKTAPAAGNGVTAADLGTTTRSNGSKQVTYHGHPLYYYIGDSGSGTTSGQGSDGFGAKWWLVAPSGNAITNSNSGSSSTPSSY